MVKILTPFVLLLALAVGSIVLDGPPPRADFTYVNRGSVNTLNLQTTSFMQDFRVARILWEGLVSSDVFSPGMDTTPGVAERWELSPDRLTYTFRLRADARWSNGDPVTAEDFAFTWRRGLLPEIGNKYINLLWFIRGAKAFTEWRQRELNALSKGESAYGSGDDAGLSLWEATKVRFAQTVGVKAIDERTLVVTLERPLPYFIEVCGFPTLFPVYRPHTDPDAEGTYEPIDRRSGRLIMRPGWTRPGVLVTNGPMRLTRWRFMRDMVFERNEHYWNQAAIHVDTIIQRDIEDANAGLLAFETGAIDWLADVDIARYGHVLYAKKRQFLSEHREEYERMTAMGMDPIAIARALPDDPRNHFHPIPAFGTYFWNFNCLPTLPDGRPNPFHRAEVRRAFAMVIDKRAITDRILRIGNPVADTFIPPSSLGGYPAVEGLRGVSHATTAEEREAIIDEARALLASAGYPDPASDFIEVGILYNKESYHEKVAEAIQADWERAFGVTCRLEKKDVNSYRQDLKNQSYITARAGWFGDYGDPTTFLDLLQSENENNDRGFKDPHYDGLLAAAADELDPARRMEILAEAEAYMLQQQPLVPLFGYILAMMFNAHEVSGITSHSRQDQYIGFVDMLGDGRGADVPMAIPPAGSN